MRGTDLQDQCINKYKMVFCEKNIMGVLLRYGLILPKKCLFIRTTKNLKAECFVKVLKKIFFSDLLGALLKNLLNCLYQRMVEEKEL